MATQLLRKDKNSKSNWIRMLDAANKIAFEDGQLKAGKGWKIDDMDTHTISAKLKDLGINHEVKDLYTIIIE